jgi:hypothetical protein
MQSVPRSEQSPLQQYGQCNIEARSCNHCCSGKAISVTYSECVFVALDIQRIAICRLPRSTTFFHIISKRHDFRLKKFLNTKRVFWFSLQLLPETFLTLRRIEREMITNVHIYIYIYIYVCFRIRAACYCCLILMKLELLNRFSKSSQISNYMKIGPKEAPVVPCGQTDGQRDVQAWRS